MKLLRLSYTNPAWELKNLEFSPVNLLVAKNATGKSRTLLTLDFLINVITQKKEFDRVTNWDIQFQTDSGSILYYKFTTFLSNAKHVVGEETLLINDDRILFRDNTQAILKNYLTGEDDIVYPPGNKLTLHTNRDIKKYPFLEDIVNWAENSFGSKFGNIMPYSAFNQQYANLLSTVDDIPVLFKSLSEQGKSDVIAQFNTTGYNISEVTVQGNRDLVLYVKENGVSISIPHFQLAQGMYRTLSLIIFLEFLFSKNKPEMFIIDDLCEGLDYERAKKLGKLIFDKCLSSDIQLVATSNDIFLMEVVDIKYWNVLIRKGKVVTALNYVNHPKIFDDFRFTGLSNFDFFSSDFINQELAS